jgi:O-antigen/teichoic acid export membrane protein
VVRVLALRAVLGGLENIGIIAFRKDLAFAKEFRFNVYQKLITFAIAVLAAFYLRSYWALVVGIVAGRAISTVLSYRMHPYRPRLSLAALPELWSYSNWMLAVHIGDYVNMKADEMIVGNVAGTAAMGHYNVAADLATAPTVELVLPMSRALFPGYAKLRGHTERVRETYLMALSVVATVSFASAMGIALIAPDLVSVVLGPQWAESTPLIVWLALSGALFAISNTSVTLLSAAGRAKQAGVIGWLRNAVLLPTLAFLGVGWGAVAVAGGRAAVMLLFVPILLGAAMRAIDLTARQMTGALWRPATASMAMAAVVWSLNGVLPGGSPTSRLVLDAIVGAASFAIATVILWRLAGSPEGPERTALDWLTARSARHRPPEAAATELLG